MEKADNVYVSLGDFGWSDLGTWGSLYDLSPKDENNNVTLKSESLIYNSKNNIVVLPEGKLAVIEGLEGFLIAESENVLLICKKDEEHAIRKYVNDAQIKMGDDRSFLQFFHHLHQFHNLGSGRTDRYFPVLPIWYFAAGSGRYSGFEGALIL